MAQMGGAMTRGAYGAGRVAGARLTPLKAMRSAALDVQMLVRQEGPAPT